MFFYEKKIKLVGLYGLLESKQTSRFSDIEMVDMLTTRVEDTFFPNFSFLFVVC